MDTNYVCVHILKKVYSPYSADIRQPTICGFQAGHIISALYATETVGGCNETAKMLPNPIVDKSAVWLGHYKTILNILRIWRPDFPKRNLDSWNCKSFTSQSAILNPMIPLADSCKWNPQTIYFINSQSMILSYNSWNVNGDKCEVPRTFVLVKFTNYDVLIKNENICHTCSWNRIWI